MNEQKPQVEVCQDGTVRVRDREGRDRVVIMHDENTGQPMVLICRKDGRTVGSVGFPTEGDSPTVLLHDDEQKIKAGFQFQENGEVTIATFADGGLVHTETTEPPSRPIPGVSLN